MKKQKKEICLKHILLITIVLFMIISFIDSVARPHQFGLGASFDELIGVNAKLWVTPTDAFDCGLGLSIGGDRIGGMYSGNYNSDSRVHFHFDYLLHQSSMPMETQIDMFIEFIPSLQLTSEPGFAIDPTFGMRYYF